ncbi:unnamed protein product [Cyclocybe aegerita]|uniref:Uncharacterized protein n=1 Tax=Cyclocybe aegerita TaxID=1973307 RepID=A0A8S0XDY9_CYCAE|nr:unnamed protein product [Cyclocybe aegerita]
MSTPDKLTTVMSIPNLLGLDPLTCTLTILSIFGLLFSSVNFLRHFTPTNLYIRTADLVAQTRALYDALDQEDLLPGEAGHHVQLNAWLELLEDRIKPLMFVILPTKNIIQILRAWTKIWALLEISREIEIFRVGVQTLSEQRKRMDRVRAEAKREGIRPDLKKLEAAAEATTEMFISTLGVRDSQLTKDLESCRSRCTSPEQGIYPEHPEHNRPLQISEFVSGDCATVAGEGVPPLYFLQKQQ